MHGVVSMSNVATVSVYLFGGQTIISGIFRNEGHEENAPFNNAHHPWALLEVPLTTCQHFSLFIISIFLFCPKPSTWDFGPQHFLSYYHVASALVSDRSHHTNTRQIILRWCNLHLRIPGNTYFSSSNMPTYFSNGNPLLRPHWTLPCAPPVYFIMISPTCVVGLSLAGSQWKCGDV